MATIQPRKGYRTPIYSHLIFSDKTIKCQISYERSRISLCFLLKWLLRGLDQSKAGPRAMLPWRNALKILFAVALNVPCLSLLPVQTSFNHLFNGVIWKTKKETGISRWIFLSNFTCVLLALTGIAQHIQCLRASR